MTADKPIRSEEKVQEGPASASSPDRPAQAIGSAAREELLDSLSEEIRESFIGDKAIPAGRKISPAFWWGCLGVLWRLVWPHSNLTLSVICFWLARGVGLAILISWAWFGVREALWSTPKLQAGLLILLFGPLVLRAIEFVFEWFLLRGMSREAWRDFWNFRRMMTPRAIQTAFLVGFWVLVVMGGKIVLSGLTDMVRNREIASLRSFLNRSTYDINDTVERMRLLRESDSPLSTYLRERLISPAALRELEALDAQADQDAPPRPSPSLEATLSAEWNRLMDTSDSADCFSKIVRGLMLMVLGPLALRFTAESIILLFRVNETLTDIAKQLEIANRRADKDNDT